MYAMIMFVIFRDLHVVEYGNRQEPYGCLFFYRKSCSSRQDVQVWSLGHIHPGLFVTPAATTGGRTEGEEPGQEFDLD